MELIRMDIRIEEALKKEKERQQNNIELIASENYASKDVIALQGSIFTNKLFANYVTETLKENIILPYI